MALSVYLHDQPVGQLQLDVQRRFVFQYNTAWLAFSGAFPLSLSLPLQQAAYIDDTARPFFANLLPEAQLHEVIARKLGLSQQNDYALLEAIGGECAGAVSLWPHHQPPGVDGHYQPLSEEALHTLIEQMPRHPMLAGKSELRLSLAGAQHKLPVYFDGQTVSLPHGVKPSSHILKPVIRDYQNSVFNEAYCMQLARCVGLSVPDVTLFNNRGQWLYLVNRYDRQKDPAGNLLRLHQEDFCQALGVLPASKYEKEGGPGLVDCFKLVREYSIQPVIDLRQLLAWVVFNYLIGNADAHGKNISLLLTQQGPRLAPFYDLMCTAIYPDLTNRSAMKIGGESRPNWIITSSWQKLAIACGIDFKWVRQILATLSRSFEEHAPALAEDYQRKYSNSEVSDAIQTVIGERIGKVRNDLIAAGDVSH